LIAPSSLLDGWDVFSRHDRRKARVILGTKKRNSDMPIFFRHETNESILAVPEDILHVFFNVCDCTAHVGVKIDGNE
jgi:hypothetical protein